MQFSRVYMAGVVRRWQGRGQAITSCSITFCYRKWSSVSVLIIADREIPVADFALPRGRFRANSKASAGCYGPVAITETEVERATGGGADTPKTRRSGL